MVGDQTQIIVPPNYQPHQIVIIQNNSDPLEESKKSPSDDFMMSVEPSLEASSRVKFLRKVYGLVGSTYFPILVMMWITIGFCFLSYFSKGFFEFQVNNLWCFFVFFGIAVVLTIVVMVCGNDCLASKSNGLKAGLLLIIVLCFSYVTSFFTSIYAKAYGAPLVL